MGTLAKQGGPDYSARVKNTLLRAACYLALAPAAALAISPTASAQVPGLKKPALPALPAAEEAPIALMIDMTSGQVLYSRNADRRFMPASITKVMTLFLAFELMEEGKLDPGQIITPHQDTWREWSQRGSRMFLPVNAQVQVRDLILGIANVSANDGSIALAEGYSGSVEAWTTAMNAKAHEIGMVDSYFSSPNGWPDEGKTFTSANDLAVLAKAMIERHPSYFSRYIGHPGFTYNGIAQPNHDPMLGKVDGADGIKTGFTNEAGYGFLGTAQRNGQRLIMVVGGVDSGRLRGELSRKFIEWGFQNFERKRLFFQGAVVARARVQDGSALNVDLVADRDIYVNLPRSSQQSVRVTVEYDGPLRAPFAAGEEVATMKIEAAGMQPAIIPLMAAEAVTEAGPFRRMVNGVAGWFR